MRPWFWMMPLWLAVTQFAAAVEVRSFDDPAKAQAYEELVRDLRCLVCQNQSLADSDADLARDLRDEVYRIIESGQTREQASQFLVERYGDFVLYRPPVRGMTLLLWFGPLLMVALALYVLYRIGRSRRARNGQRLMNEEETARLRRLQEQYKDQ